MKNRWVCACVLLFLIQFTFTIFGDTEHSELKYSGAVRVNDTILEVRFYVEEGDGVSDRVASRYVLDLQGIFFTNQKQLDEYYTRTASDGQWTQLLVAFNTRAQIPYYPRLYRSDELEYLAVLGDEYRRFVESYLNYELNSGIYKRINDDIKDINEFLARSEWSEGDRQHAIKNFFSNDEAPTDAESTLAKLRGLRITDPMVVRSYFFADETDSHMALVIAHEATCELSIKAPVMLIFAEDKGKWRIFMPDRFGNMEE